MPKKPNNNSHESRLGAYAKALSEIDANEPSEGKPAKKSEQPNPQIRGAAATGGMPLQVGDTRRVRQRRKARPRDKGKAKAGKELCNLS